MGQFEQVYYKQTKAMFGIQFGVPSSAS